MVDLNKIMDKKNPKAKRIESKAQFKKRRPWLEEDKTQDEIQSEMMDPAPASPPPAVSKKEKRGDRQGANSTVKPTLAESSSVEKVLVARLQQKRDSTLLGRYRAVLSKLSSAQAMHYFVLYELSDNGNLHLTSAEIARELTIKPNAVRLLMKALREAGITELVSDETSQSARVYKLLI